MAILEEVFATKTLAEWKELLSAARGAWAPIQTPEEVHEDPQTIANGFIRRVDYPGGGLEVPVPPILSRSAASGPVSAKALRTPRHEFR
jgi:crotonobetainyl-CoA:carnitine CoA-transferase CaiB-like acyl-CoA transferase